MNQTVDPSSVSPQILRIRGVMESDGRRIVLWDRHSRDVISQTKMSHEEGIPPLISRSCTHLKGRGGVKGCIRDVQRHVSPYPFVARFDVASYYDSIDHAILLSQLEATAPPLQTISIVRHYLRAPDCDHTGVGMVAGGSISPLLGALYLKPLDDAFSHREGILYRRFMDDFVILATTRWRLRRAIRLVHQIPGELKMQVHETKRCIGRTIQGFDFPLVYYPSFSKTSPVR